jgi:hypothetical protein
MLKIDVITVKSVKIAAIIIYLKAYEINFRLTFFKKCSISVNKYSYMSKFILHFYLIFKNKNFITKRFSKKSSIFKVLYLNQNGKFYQIRKKISLL